MTIWSAMAVALTVLGAAVAAEGARPFLFDPVPRWAEEPETEVVCVAIAAECPGLLKDGELDTNWSYAELFDADGVLAGVRSVRSTGCKPLDEHLLLGQRSFRTTFSKPGKPDLDEITAELAPGTPKDSIRIVRRGETHVSFGC